MGKINIYNLGGEGNNLVKNPLQLGDNELTQSQNAELIPDADKGGEGALSKRGGLAALTTALAGSVTGIVGLPLTTTYTKTLLAALQTEDSNTFLSTTNGTSWSAITTPLRAATISQFGSTELLYRASLRGAAFGSKIYYPSADYTSDVTAPESTGTPPPMNYWDGTTALKMFTVPTDNPNGYACHGITDMIVANGKVYFSVFDPGGTSVNLCGRVFSFDPQSGLVKQIANAFGPGTGEVANGFPCALAFYNGQLWAGQNNQSGSASDGNIVRCFPDVDAAWTVDKATMVGVVTSLAEYRGNLYAGLRCGSNGNTVTIAVRTSSTGAWTASYSGAASGFSFGQSLAVFNDELYAVEWQDSATDIIHIKKYDGTSWTTDRDVDATDVTFGAQSYRTNMLVWESALYLTISSTSVSAADGVILRKSGGTWTKVATDNINGFLIPLTIRS